MGVDLTIEAHISQSMPPVANIKSLFKKLLDGSSAIFRFPNRESNSERAKILWLVKLRWLATTLFFVISLPALALGLLDRTTMPIYIGILGVIFVFNLLAQLTLAESRKPIPPVIICFHLAFDLLALSAILFTMDGFSNPLVVLFLLNASLGGILIPGRLNWSFLVLTHSLLASLQAHYFFHHLIVTSDFLSVVFVSHVMIFSFWVIMRSLGAYLEKQNRLQAQSRIITEKQDRLRALGALAAGFSHEFASPLNTAKLRLERAVRYQPSEDIGEALEAIRTCEQVIHQMNASQIDTRDFQNKKIDISSLLIDVIDTWKDQNPKAVVAVQIKHPADAFVPPITFAQVILNLLDNSEESAPSKPILVSLSVAGDFHELSIQDEGNGFAERILSKIGEPFVTSKPHGTGLGLYVSQLFAQSLGGDLVVRNLEKRGSLVTIRWPLMRDEHE